MCCHPIERVFDAVRVGTDASGHDLLAGFCGLCWAPVDVDWRGRVLSAVRRGGERASAVMGMKVGGVTVPGHATVAAESCGNRRAS